MKRLFLAVAILLLAMPAYGSQLTVLEGDVNNKTSLDTNFGNINTMFTEVYSWLDQGVKTTSNPSFLSLNASGGNLAAANKQVTKAWATGLQYTANLTSVIYGGKHYICTSTHTAGSTTEPGTGADWATVWTVGTLPGTAVTIDASGFDNNLATTDDTVQEVAQKLDDLVAGSATVEDTAYSSTTWDTDTDGTSKNTIRDYLVNFDADGDGSFTDESWFPVGSGDDQTAAEVNITDAGSYFTGTTVETVTQELGAKLPTGADGEYGLIITNNTTRSPTAATNELYPEANVWKVNQNGTESSIAIGPTSGPITFTGPTAARIITFPDAAITVARSDAGNTFTGDQTVNGIVRADVSFNSYTAAQTLTEAAHNSGVVQMTTADEVTMWDCETANVGNTVLLWARDAEKIEVVPASGDHFNLFAGTALTANNELDVAATAGTKVTLMCTVDDTWSVFHETAASADGGAAD